MRYLARRHDKVLAATILKLFPEFVTPNILTSFRLVATPFVLALLYGGYFRFALVAFLLVAVTDALDGSLARTRGQISQWGIIWDPIADKILIASVVILLVLNHFPIELTILIFFTEAIFLFGGYLRRRQGVVVSANGWGKMKMLLQVIGIALFLIFLLGASNVYAYASYAVFIVSIVFALMSLYRHGI